MYETKLSSLQVSSVGET